MLSLMLLKSLVVLNAPLHWGEILVHDYNATKWPFLNLYYGECGLTPLIL